MDSPKKGRAYTVYYGGENLGAYSDFMRATTVAIRYEIEVWLHLFNVGGDTKGFKHYCDVLAEIIQLDETNESVLFHFNERRRRVMIDCGYEPTIVTISIVDADEKIPTKRELLDVVEALCSLSHERRRGAVEGGVANSNP